ncbi:MAG: histidine phosphatase family protein [Clostridia bacterium]|nr:histidine phosphatase family protein [Clostridia bacterium]
MKTLIYVIRHGQSYGNQHRIFLGHTDKDLTELGRKQAERTAQELANIDFAAIYASDLCRAYNTALPHAKIRGMTVIPDKRLRELYCGEWEALSVEEIIDRYGTLYTVDWAEKFGTFRLPGGESVEEGSLRMIEAITEMASDNPDKNILVATHAAVIRGMFAKCYGIAPRDVASKLAYPSNASYSVLEYDGEKLIPVSYSNDGYLADMLTTWKD